MSKSNEEIEITKLGNPGNPTGTAGEQMLERMNNSHYEVTGWALDFLEIQNDDSILDIGCGGGMTLKRISSLSTKGKLYGIDHSQIAVNKTSALNLDLITNKRLNVLNGSVEKLPYENNFFNKIITVESFYFWPNPVENLKEVLRVLKHNGKFLLVADIYGKEGLSEHVLNNIKMFNLLNPTPSEFKEMFKKAGFSKTEINFKENTDWIAVIGHK